MSCRFAGRIRCYGSFDFISAGGDDDRILVDYVAKYENRERDLRYVRERLNLPALGRQHIQKVKPRSDHYSKNYDDETREIVRSMYAKDIELFGYEFERP